MFIFCKFKLLEFKENNEKIIFAELVFLKIASAAFKCLRAKIVTYVKEINLKKSLNRLVLNNYRPCQSSVMLSFSCDKPLRSNEYV